VREIVIKTRRQTKCTQNKEQMVEASLESSSEDGGSRRFWPLEGYM